MNPSLLKARAGFALAVTIIVLVGVAVLASGAVMISANGTLVREYAVQQDRLAHAADAGLEEARARLNATPSLYPDSLYVAVESNAQVYDASGQPVTGVTRSTYVGPVGVTSGQFGINGAVVSVVRSGPNLFVRRSHILQESFSKYAYFTDVEPSNIAFGGGDQIFGPVHSNDDIRIYSSRATFFGHVTTARTIVDEHYGTFREGYTEQAPDIPLPQLADLQKLRLQAIAGSTNFSTSNSNPVGEARMRIEFVAVDLNDDLDTSDDNEGFMRIYTSSSSSRVVGGNPVGDLRNSENCGHEHVVSGNPTFVSADDHSSWGSDDNVDALTSNTRVCYLGGDPRITNGWVASNSDGSWLPWSGTVSPALAARRPDAGYLFPINRPLNPNFKGVIYVDGDVAISGVLRGRVTVAATGDIVIADDVTYSMNPGMGSCDDILGLFAGGDVVMAYTPINAPWQPRSGYDYRSYDDTSAEFVHGFVLTLNNFTVEDYDQGSTDDEPCGSTSWGRGCLFLTGGIIQRQRGAVGTTAGTGYLKRYSYDQCGESAPPPYFPTTGRFARGAWYDVDPAGFDIDAYYRMLTAGS